MRASQISRQISRMDKDLENFPDRGFWDAVHWLQIFLVIIAIIARKTWFGGK